MDALKHAAARSYQAFLVSVDRWLEPVADIVDYTYAAQEHLAVTVVATRYVAPQREYSEIMHGMWTAPEKWYGTFRLPNGTEKEIEISDNSYNRLKAGGMTLAIVMIGHVSGQPLLVDLVIPH